MATTFLISSASYDRPLSVNELIPVVSVKVSSEYSSGSFALRRELVLNKKKCLQLIQRAVFGRDENFYTTCDCAEKREMHRNQRYTKLRFLNANVKNGLLSAPC